MSKRIAYVQLHPLARTREIGKLVKRVVAGDEFEVIPDKKRKGSFTIEMRAEGQDSEEAPDLRECLKNWAKGRLMEEVCPFCFWYDADENRCRWTPH